LSGEFASQKDFFGEVSFMSDMEARIVRGERPPIPESTPLFIKALIELCWHNDPEKRPSFDQVRTRLLSPQQWVFTCPFIISALNA